jgi:VanZ family protein
MSQQVPMLYHFFRFAKPVSWLAIIALAVASWTPGDEMVRTGLNGHLEHVIAYLLTALAFMLAYPSRSAWHVGLGLAAYAGVLELGQLIVPGRNAAFIDWAAGIVGAFAGCLLVMGWRAIQRSLQNAN